MYSQRYRYKGKLPTFNGVGRSAHNNVKVKAFWLIQTYRDKGLGNPTALDLYVSTGCDYSSLKVSLVKWTKWGYVRRHPGPVYRYSLREKGRRFLALAFALAPMERYKAEIEAWQRATRGIAVNVAKYKAERRIFFFLREMEEHQAD